MLLGEEEDDAWERPELLWALPPAVVLAMVGMFGETEPPLSDPQRKDRLSPKSKHGGCGSHSRARAVVDSLN